MKALLGTLAVLSATSTACMGAGAASIFDAEISRGFTVFIRAFDQAGDPHVCAGTLIHQELVVTTARCVDGYSGWQIYMDPAEIDESGDEKWYAVDTMIPELYESSSDAQWVFDLGIIKLDRPAPDWKDPAKLPPRGLALDDSSVPMLVVAGFGTDDSDGDGHPAFRVSEVARHPAGDAQRLPNGVRARYSDGAVTLHALGPSPAPGSCVSSPGAPAYRRVDDDPWLLGVRSIGLGSAGIDSACRKDAYYVNIGPWVGWIEQVSKDLLSK